MRSFGKNQFIYILSLGFALVESQRNAVPLHVHAEDSGRRCLPHESLTSLTWPVQSDIVMMTLDAVASGHNDTHSGNTRHRRNQAELHNLYGINPAYWLFSKAERACMCCPSLTGMLTKLKVEHNCYVGLLAGR